MVCTSSQSCRGYHLILTTTELAPVARAILLRSAFDLEREMALHPESLTERHRDLTALQLCTGWPEGLEQLLNTKARELLDAGTRKGYTGTPAPIYMALSMGCPRSADLLLKAGCALGYGPETNWYDSSHSCLAVVASHLAERRCSLLRFCQKELSIYLDQDPSRVPDEEASALCAALNRSGIPIPRPFFVPPDYTTLFHFPRFPFFRFEEVWDHGFHDIQSRDSMGRTPHMVWRPDEFRAWFVDAKSALGRQVARGWQWIQDKGCLGQIQQDPLALGLNVSSTGWHAMAAKLGYAAGDRPWYYSSTRFPHRMIQDLSQTTVRDRCVCWCNPEGLGCSPLKSFWKEYASGLPAMSGTATMFWKHCLLHHYLNAKHDQHGNRLETLRSMALEYVRLLTFETLDMTHTCCYLEEVERLRSKTPLTPTQRKEMSGESNRFRWGQEHVIASCSPELVQEVRSDGMEQRDARQLDELMREFEALILQLDWSNPKDLENFIWGPWRDRISSLFAVDTGTVAEMENVVGQVSLCKSKSCSPLPCHPRK